MVIFWQTILGEKILLCEGNDVIFICLCFASVCKLNRIFRISVVCNMMPSVLLLRPNTDEEFFCSIPYTGYKWSSVNILQQNSSDSAVILSVSSDGMITSKHTRINGSVIINEEYINVTVSFNSSSGSGLCQLNQSYVCDISLMDTSIGTVAANSTIILESEYFELPCQYQHNNFLEFNDLVSFFTNDTLTTF